MIMCASLLLNYKCNEKEMGVVKKLILLEIDMQSIN